MFNTVTRMYEGRSRKCKHDIKATENVEVIQLLEKVFTTIPSNQNIH